MTETEKSKFNPENTRTAIVQSVVTADQYGFGIVKDNEDSTLRVFDFGEIEGYRGEYPKEIGLQKGTVVEYVMDRDGYVDAVRFEFRDRRHKLFGRWVLPF